LAGIVPNPRGTRTDRFFAGVLGFRLCANFALQSRAHTPIVRDSRAELEISQTRLMMAASKPALIIPFFVGPMKRKTADDHPPNHRIVRDSRLPCDKAFVVYGLHPGAHQSH
jgi:hypothetical protein